MTITLVIDSFDDLNNGTTASARRFVENLRKCGHTVRILTAGNPGPDKYILPKWDIPIVSHFSEPQGITFAKPVEETIRQAFTGTDIAHFYLPFPMGNVAHRIAKEMGVPCIAAFHVQAENITYQIGLGKFDHAAKFCYRKLRQFFYHDFDHIHCPTKFIAGELKANHYKQKLHVISNGVDEVFTPGPAEPHEKFNILMIGRLSPEKRQDLVIKAVSLSKYKDKIHLILAGQGPEAEKYKKLAEEYIPGQITFGFYNTEQLLQVIRNSDLYVHCSDIEIEAIACMEAFSCGIVPVIANAKKSATVQFALDEKSLFKAGNAKSLAERIDYWIEHPEEKAELSKKYIEEGEQYRVLTSVKKMEEVYDEIIAETKGNQNA